MNEQLRLLIMLHDLDLQLRELRNQEARKIEEKHGFKLVDHSHELIQAREELVSKLDPALFSRYELLMQKYGRAIVPIVHGVCYGCFILLPTAEAYQEDKNERVSTCSNCGRFLYWID